jgi:defect-in-organelle-trafficking protein DotD
MTVKHTSVTNLFAFAMALALLTSGCAPRKIDQQLVAEPDPVTLRLAMAADRASSALQTLAAIEQAKNPGASVSAAPSAPQELRRIISVDYNGPIEPMARAAADRAGYTLEVNGDKPPAPIIVSLVAREKSVVEVLRDLGLQAGRRADIVVDPDRRIVELNYASNYSE